MEDEGGRFGEAEVDEAMTGGPVGDDPRPPARPLLTTVLIVVVGAGTAIALWTAVMRRTEFEAAFPGLTPVLYLAYLATAGVSVVALAGLWRMQRWAPNVLAILGCTACLLDLLADAPFAHLATSALSTLLILASIFPVRKWFLSDPGHTKHSA